MTPDNAPPQPLAPHQRSSIRDVAARAGVSVSTVSRILNGNYPPAPRTREKVMRAVKDLDYDPNPHARALSGSKSATVGIVVRHLDDGFLLSVVQSIAVAVAETGRLCLIGTTGNDRELEVLRQMNAQHVQAIVLVGAVLESDEYHRAMVSFVSGLASSGTRLVLCARPAIGPDAECPVVEYDNEGGTYAATSHLISRGHRRILFLGGPEGSLTLRRRNGYRRALADLGVEADPTLEVGPAWNRETGRAMMTNVLGPGGPAFTAVLTHTDQVAAGVIQTLRERGMSVPEDVSVVGFADSPLAADLRLTSVHIPAVELGRTAARLALGTEPGDTHTMFATHVVVRDSVAPPHVA
ncbi:substrate-binding domain-containing protein [Microbacterium immunditiarum]|uniref:LacI family transcriptional regulator n=1 Tax=Microbacterium immunditiarum TaxID=337480 RepID=A0A7Y9GRX3_9MICO|nr:LacI family transcriptional regulator [Microbacterium immunditiarum]